MLDVLSQNDGIESLALNMSFKTVPRENDYIRIPAVAAPYSVGRVFAVIHEYYGDEWYLSFFNRYHLSDQINSILKSPNKKKIAESKMGTIWVNKLSPNLLKKSSYSYASTYYDYLIARNKITQ
jgi:hypothetical protein